MAPRPPRNLTPEEATRVFYGEVVEPPAFNEDEAGAFLYGAGSQVGGAASSGAFESNNSLVSALKSIGSNTLHALSVPGAVVTTGLTNAIQALKGDPGVSWKNLAGTFRGRDFAGGAGLLRALGVDNTTAQRWGGLGIDIALDPTWLLAVVPGVGAAKGAAAAERLRLMGQVAKAGEEAGDIVRGGRAFIRTGRLSPGAVERIANPQQYERLLSLRAQASLARLEMQRMGFVPQLRFGLGRKSIPTPAGVNVKVPRGITVPLARSPKFARPNLTVTRVPWVRKSPIAQAAHDVHQAGQGAAHFQDKALQRMRAQFGLTELDTAKLFQLATIRNHDLKGYRALRDEMRASGEWGAEYDQTLRVLGRLSDRQALAQGMLPHRLQARAMQQALNRPPPGIDMVRARAELSSAFAGSKLREATAANLGRRTRALNRLTGRGNRIVQEGNELTRLAGEMGVLREAERAVSRLQTVQLDKARIDRMVSMLRPSKGGVLKKQYRRALERRARALKQQLGAAELRLREAQYDMEAARSRLSALGARTPATEGGVAGRLAKLAQQKEAIPAARGKIMEAYGRSQDRAMREYGDALARLNEVYAREMDAVMGAWHGSLLKFAQEHGLTEFTKRVHHRTGKVVKKKGETYARPLTIPEIEDLAVALRNHGQYVARQLGNDALRQIREFRWQLVKAGRLMPDLMGRIDALADFQKALKPRKYEHVTQWVTREQMVANVTKMGATPEEAALYADRWERFFKFASEPQMYPRSDTVRIDPNLNIFEVFARRESQTAVDLVRKATIQLIKDAGLTDAVKLFEELQKVYTMNGSPVTMQRVFGTFQKGRFAGEARLGIAMSYLKAWFTVMNPGHYMLNAYGSFINAAINGGFRHLFTGASGSLGFTGRRVGQQQAGDETYRIGEKVYTGDELNLLARMSGLGMGYTGAEIETLLRLNHASDKRGFLMRTMTKWNMDRENADRVWAWMNHMKMGNDPFTSAASVLRYAFDYSNATAWEQVWGRNLFLFYTWMKNNFVYQGYGVLTRPGAYSTLNHFENSRPKHEGEPEWWAKAGGIGSMTGLVTFGNPMADIFKYDISLDNFKRSVFGAVNPVARVPVEISLNRSAFTGAEIERFGGQQTPSGIASLIEGLGLYDFEDWRGRAGGELGPALPAKLAYLLSAFTGPYGNLSHKLTRPDDVTSGTADLVAQLTGLREQPVDPEAFARNLRYRLAREKADATRRRGYTTP